MHRVMGEQQQVHQRVVARVAVAMMHHLAIFEGPANQTLDKQTVLGDPHRGLLGSFEAPAHLHVALLGLSSLKRFRSGVLDHAFAYHGAVTFTGNGERGRELVGFGLELMGLERSARRAVRHNAKAQGLLRLGRIDTDVRPSDAVRMKSQSSERSFEEVLAEKRAAQERVWALFERGELDEDAAKGVLAGAPRPKLTAPPTW